MKIVCLSDSFKGSLDSGRIGQLVKQAAEKVWNDVSVKTLPVADGGEGTVEAVLKAAAGKREACTVSDPLGRKITAEYGLLDEDTAVMEMAAAAGLPLLTEEEKNPLYTTTYGAGQMLLHILDRGCRKVYIGLGGSATNDCGMGFLQALGVRFYDKSGKFLDGCGEALEKVEEIDFSGLDPRVKQCEITVLCDVENPLLGPEGAVYTFAVQKGGGDVLDILEAGTAHFVRMVKHYLDVNEKTPGCGAAGGLGFCLLEILKAEKKRGILAILEMIHAKDWISGADFVVTGEGRIDWQSAGGKAVWGVASLCRRLDKPLIALVGSAGPGAAMLHEDGVTAIVPVPQEAVPLQTALEKAEEYYLTAAEETFRLLKTGMEMGAAYSK